MVVVDDMDDTEPVTNGNTIMDVVGLPDSKRIVKSVHQFDLRGMLGYSVYVG